MRGDLNSGFDLRKIKFFELKKIKRVSKRYYINVHRANKKAPPVTVVLFSIKQLVYLLLNFLTSRLSSLPQSASHSASHSHRSWLLLPSPCFDLLPLLQLCNPSSSSGSLL